MTDLASTTAGTVKCYYCKFSKDVEMKHFGIPLFSHISPLFLPALSPQSMQDALD